MLRRGLGSDRRSTIVSSLSDDPTAKPLPLCADEKKYMKKLKTFVVAATLLSGVGMTLDNALADDAVRTRDPGVKARERVQRERIHQGVKSGELTRGEARGLRKEERGIRKEERQFKADGHLTAAERAKLHSDLNKTSKHIYQEKHDAEKRATPPAN